MDPITLIVSALVAGAASAVTDTGSSVVKDSYTWLKALVKRRLRGAPEAKVVLAGLDRDPKTWEAPLRAALSAAGADRDDELLAAARALIDRVDAAGAGGKYTVHAPGAQVVQTGDHNKQDNVFIVPPHDSVNRP